MSMNRAVRFGPSLASRNGNGMGVILHLGYINPAEPVLTTPEGAGVLAGGGLIVAGALVKGKGGMLMMILGGLSALVGVGSAAYRAMAKPAGATALVAPPPPTKPQSTAQQAQQIVQQLAPTLTPLIKNLFSSSSTPAPAPAPSQMVTSYSQLAPTPAPAYSGGGMVTSLDEYGD
jgi:hypothetical protein